MSIAIPKALKKWDFIFLILLLGIAYSYSYHNILFLRPYSIHQWRQCDCLSITLNYYKEGMHFFSPTLNVCGSNGNGLICPSECPLLYYLVAFLWKIFGQHEYIFRLVNVLIGFSGLYALFKLTQELVQDGAWALLVSLLLFTSPVFSVYINNFITDGTALSIALIAWYLFVKYYKTKKLFYFNLSVLFFLLAGLLKITALLSFIPLVAIFLWELIKKPKTTTDRIFIKPLKQSIAILLLIAIILLWTSYSIRHTYWNSAEVFLTSIKPIWETGELSAHDIWVKLYQILLPQFFSFPVIFLSLALFAGILFNFKKMNRFYYWFILMVFGGSILYILLWFNNFAVHDYYLINVLIFVPATLISCLVFLKEHYPNLFNSLKLKIAFAVILSLNVYYCSVQTQIRYFPEKEYSFLVEEDNARFWSWYHADYADHTKALETITPYLRSLGISREDKVISFPDETPIITLYLMDQKGFTNYGFGDFQKSDRIKEFMRLGAKYLVVSNSSVLDNDWIKPYLKNKIGNYQNVTIYDLRTL